MMNSALLRVWDDRHDAWHRLHAKFEAMFVGVLVLFALFAVSRALV